MASGNPPDSSRPPQVAAPSPGDLIDGHKVVDFLGEGGMGWVYQVEHPESGQLLALKILHQVLSPGKLDRVRFEREFKLSSKR